MAKKFYRGSNAVIGGVCDGIANYFDLDVSAVRLVTILLSIFSLGSIALIYIIIWIIVPRGQAGYFEQKNDRKLYRSNINRIFGGVCGGIADYINVDPAIIRILFAIFFFLGIGSSGLVYLILWILLPVKR